MLIDTALVQHLLTEQFPHWADLPITAAVPQGWDNRTFRLGDTMSMRLPSAESYVWQIEKERRWLPILAPQLPLPIPRPLAMGKPSDSYPFPWSIYAWIEGKTANADCIADMSQFALDLAHFLSALQRIDARNGPLPGDHNFYRGAPLTVYDSQTRQALAALRDEVDTDKAHAVWEAALSSTWQAVPVWFHGDVAVGNLLVKDGHLHAVIDFGTSGVGDPACDTVIAWTLFEGQSRAIFQKALVLDEHTWMRGRGWALWKALIILAEHLASDPVKASQARHTIHAILSDI